MCPGDANMPVGIQNPDTAKSSPAAMPIPGQIDFEQLRVGPSIEMSLRKAWASILADACEESGAQSVLHRCVSQVSRGPRGFAIFSFLWAVYVRGPHLLVAKKRKLHSTRNLSTV
jgi:hypothetical protein